MSSSNDSVDGSRPARRNRRRLARVLSWAAFGAYSAWFAANLIPNLALRLQFEDQLIVLRYARNLAEGNGLVYNAGERVMGFTTPLFTLLSGLFVALGGDHAPAWQNAFGLFCMLGTSAVAARLLVRVGAGPAAPLAVALITFNPAAAYNYLHVGMEVHLFALLFLLALDLDLSRRTVASSVVAALLFLTRPEGALLIVMLLAANWRRERRLPVRETGAWLATSAPWLVFATIYYGSPVPATLPAKAGSFLIHTPQYLRRVGEIYADAAGSVVATYSPALTGRPWAWLPLAALAAAGIVELLRRGPSLWPLVAFPLVSVAGYGVLGAWAEFTWHYYPLSVLGAFVIALGAHATISYLLSAALAAARRLRPTSQRTARLTMQAAALTLLAVGFPVLRSTYAQAHYRVEPNPRSEGLAGMGRALGERFDGGTSVLLDEIGHIGWRAEMRIIDQAGLVTPGLRYDVPRHLVVERHRPDLLLLHNDAPARHGVRQTAAFPRNLGYRRVPNFPAAPGYRLWEFSGVEVSESSQASSLYELQRNENGHIEALIESGPDSAEPPRRFPITAGTDGTIGYLDSADLESTPFPDSNAAPVTLTGWAVDRTNPTAVVEVVIILGGSVVASTSADLSRPDVAAQHGRSFEYTGFSLSLPTDPERVRREGLVAYALSSRESAARLQFLYQPLTTGSGPETLPISDGRRLTVRDPDGGFDGSVEVVRKANGRTEISGWAADLEEGQRPRQIVVYRADEFLTHMGVNRERPDVVERHGDPRLLRTGFRGAVPGAPDPETFAARHRVFAIMLRGAAVELPYLPQPVSAP